MYRKVLAKTADEISLVEAHDHNCRLFGVTHVAPRTVAPNVYMLNQANEWINITTHTLYSTLESNSKQTAVDFFLRNFPSGAVYAVNSVEDVHSLLSNVLKR